MKLRYAILADHVNETKEGKLNFHGVFDVLFAKRAPVTHPLMCIAAVFEASVSEGSEHSAQVGMFDSDGKPVIPLSPKLPLKFKPTGRGKPLHARIVAEFSGVLFPHFGDFVFHILVDGRIEAEVPVELTQIKEQGRRVSR